jgi:hypothetical protein
MVEGVERVDRLRLVFTVEGSKGDEYEVVAERAGPFLSLTCTCVGAARGEMCKHRIALLDGVIDALLSENESDVALLPGLLAGSAAERALAHFHEVDRAYQKTRQDYEQAQRRWKAAKYALARELAVRGPPPPEMSSAALVTIDTLKVLTDKGAINDDC